MSYPTHPDTIVLRNNYYPQGLKEIDIWNYYQKVKPSILKQVLGRNVFIFMLLGDSDSPQVLVRRKDSNGRPLSLTNRNYDSFITGRTLSIHSVFNAYDNRAVIDIDSDNFDRAKQVTSFCYTSLLESFPLTVSASIRFTGKTSFHIALEFSRKMKIDSIRFLLRRFFELKPENGSRYTIELSKAKPGIPNLELQRNSRNNGAIILDSLSITGLRCMEVSLSELKSFTPIRAKILL